MCIFARPALGWSSCIPPAHGDLDRCRAACPAPAAQQVAEGLPHQGLLASGAEVVVASTFPALANAAVPPRRRRCEVRDFLLAYNALVTGELRKVRLDIGWLWNRRQADHRTHLLSNFSKQQTCDVALCCIFIAYH